MASVIRFTSEMTAVYNKAYASKESKDIDTRFDALEDFVSKDEHSGLKKEEKEEVIKRLKYDRDYFKVLFDEGKKTKCEKCNKDRLASLYCEICVREFLVGSDRNSGNAAVDELILECQEKTITPYMVIEWIPFEDIKVIKGQTTDLIEKAKWKRKEGKEEEGGSYYCEWDPQSGKLKRNKDECNVVLKKLKGDVNEWIEKAKEHLSVNNKWGCVVRCYGLTKNESEEYMLVMMKMDFNLENYLKDLNKPTLKGVIKASFETIKALSRLHEEKYSYVNLHSRNMLYLKEKGDWYIDISSYNTKEKDIFKLGQLFSNLPESIEKEPQEKATNETNHYADYRKVIKSCLEGNPSVYELWESMKEVDASIHRAE